MRPPRAGVFFRLSRVSRSTDAAYRGLTYNLPYFIIQELLDAVAGGNQFTTR